MPAYIEDRIIDTSSIKYSKTGIKLLIFIATVFGLVGLEEIKRGQLIVWFNKTEVKFDAFRNYRVKEDTSVNVKREVGVQIEIPDMFE
jgi:hypothetical protein